MLIPRETANTRTHMLNPRDIPSFVIQIQCTLGIVDPSPIGIQTHYMQTLIIWSYIPPLALGITERNQAWRYHHLVLAIFF